MNKKILTEINRYRELMGLKVITEAAAVGKPWEKILDALFEKKSEPEIEKYFRDNSEKFSLESEKLSDKLRNKGPRTTNDVLVEFFESVEKKSPQELEQMFAFMLKSFVTVLEEASIKIGETIITFSGKQFRLFDVLTKKWQFLEDKEMSGKISTIQKNTEWLEFLDEMRTKFGIPDPILDEYSEKITSESDNYLKDHFKTEERTIINKELPDESLEKVLDTVIDDWQEFGEKLWDRLENSQDPNEQKIFKLINSKYVDKKGFTGYLKTQFENAPKVNDALEKVKKDFMAQLTESEKSKFQKYYDKFCKSRKIATTSYNKGGKKSLRNLIIGSDTEFVKKGDVVEKKYKLCSIIEGLLITAIYFTAVPDLMPFLSGYVKWLWERGKKAINIFEETIADCLSQQEMDNWKQDQSQSPFNNEGNWTEYDSSICNSKQIKYKDLKQVGIDPNNLQWDNKTYLRLSKDSDGKYVGKRMLDSEVKSAIQDIQQSADSTITNTINTADSLIQNTSQNLGIKKDTVPPEPVEKPNPVIQNKQNFRTRRKKQ